MRTATGDELRRYAEYVRNLSEVAIRSNGISRIVPMTFDEWVDSDPKKFPFLRLVQHLEMMIEIWEEQNDRNPSKGSFADNVVRIQVYRDLIDLIHKDWGSLVE